MASIAMPRAAPKRNWAALPWQMMGAGLALCLLALLTRLGSEDDPGAGRLLTLTAGLLAAGIGLAIRLGSGGPAFLDRVLGPSRQLLLNVIAFVFAAVAAGATVIFILSFYEYPWLPWKTGQSVVLWIVTAPLAIATAYRAVQLKKQGRSVTAAEESAVLLLLASLCCFIGCWALYLPGNPESWDTIRMTLAVFTVVALVGAPLALASVRVRRWTISVLAVLHVGAIATATLSAPPSPWFVTQIWARLSRPYLEFMYLNNAYHFYSPEPGPTTYLWFRLIYVDDKGNQFGDWYKVPDLDEEGNSRHPVSLEYQRMMALTDHTNAPQVPQPPIFVTDKDGKGQVADFIKRRQDHSDGTIRVGQRAPSVVIPFHPYVQQTQQFSMPSDFARKLIASYARHVAYLKAEHPDLPDYKLKWVKVYRVQHAIPPVHQYAKVETPMPADDPVLYQPYYMGRFDTEGKLLDSPIYAKDGTVLVEGDAFLYWLVPILRDDPDTLDSPIKDYARKHAGDPNWIRHPLTKKWVDHEPHQVDGKWQ